MAEVGVRIRAETREALEALAEELGLPVAEVAARAVEAYRRQQFLERVNASYAALRADPVAWQEELDERALWDATLADGLGEE